MTPNEIRREAKQYVTGTFYKGDSNGEKEEQKNLKDIQKQIAK